MKILVRNEWKILKDVKDQEAPDLVGIMLENRGIKNTESIRTFLSPELKVMYDPFLLPDMGNAVECILENIEKKKKILIYGDYDADGVSATAIMCMYLESIGADAAYMIPQRLTDGYGLSDEIAGKIIEMSPSLVITVDNGIASYAEIEILSKSGIKTIVTDHHECPEKIPDALAVIDPKRTDSIYPFRELCGAGVALKVVQALCTRTGDPDAWKSYVDICALATVADMVPLLDENRMFVYKGIEILNSAGNPGIKELARLSVSGTDTALTAMSLGYLVAPKINAAGRMGDCTRAVSLLMEKDIGKCFALARELVSENELRQNTETKIYEEAREIIKEKYREDRKSPIVVYKMGWHSGVIGIVASRIAQEYKRTAFVFAGENAQYKGSVRSADKTSVLEAIEYASDHVEKFGGHKAAAGLTVKEEEIDLFEEKLKKFYMEIALPSGSGQELVIDAAISSSPIDVKNAKALTFLEPYGNSNEEPLFACFGLTVKKIVPLSGGKHMKISFIDGDKKAIEGIAFGTDPKLLTFTDSDLVDIAFNLRINEWRGNISAQAVIREIRTSDMYQEDLAVSQDLITGFRQKKETIHELILGKGLDPEKYIPSKTEFGSIYKILADKFGYEPVLCDICSMRDIMRISGLEDLSFFKIYIVLEIFSQTDLIELEIETRDKLRIRVKEKKKKVALSSSETFRRITSREKQ